MAGIVWRPDRSMLMRPPLKCLRFELQMAELESRCEALEESQRTSLTEQLNRLSAENLQLRDRNDELSAEIELMRGKLVSTRWGTIGFLRHRSRPHSISSQWFGRSFRSWKTEPKETKLSYSRNSIKPVKQSGKIRDDFLVLMFHWNHSSSNPDLNRSMIHIPAI